MKRIIFSILGVLLIGLSTCKKQTEDDYVYLLYVAAVLGYNLDLQSPVLYTSEGTFVAPQLRNDFEDLGNGSTFLANLEYNKAEQVTAEYTILSDLSLMFVDKVSPQATEKGDFFASLTPPPGQFSGVKLLKP